MEYTLRKFLFVFCFVHALKPDILIWAQDTTTSSRTPAPNNVESTFPVADAKEETVTPSLLSESCSDDCTTQSIEHCQCNCTGPSLKKFCDQINTVESSGELSTTASNTAGEEKTTDLPNSPASNDEITTSLPATMTTENVETTETTTAPPFNCTTEGIFPHPNDCRRYYNCSQIASSVTEQLCPTGLAFNTELSSCMRDLSPCSPAQGGFTCNQSGNFPDPNNDTNVYYRCVPYLDGQPNVYHKYIVRCGAGRIYIPELGKCFVDLNAIGSNPTWNFNPYEPSDEQLVKAELKQWKLREKAKLKEEKNKLKYIQKQQKELAKQQAKDAKEKDKAAKMQQKEQQESMYSYDN